VKERYRGRLCPIGNINNKTTMVTGTPEDVRREALECLCVAAPGGGYILAYVGVAKENGAYPHCNQEVKKSEEIK
jgi:uroporphyrinogen-III decarboxylase